MRAGKLEPDVPHEFLSDDWIAAVLTLQSEFIDRVTPPDDAIVMNVVVRDAPFADDDLKMFIDTRSGLAEIGSGHLDDGEVTVTTDHATAKALFVDQDQQAIMQAFLSGKVLIQGDMAKLMIMQANATMPSSDLQVKLSAQLRELTQS